MYDFMFYCNASKRTGYGHLSRCLNIAREISDFLNKGTVHFIGEFDSFSKVRINNLGFGLLSDIPQLKQTSVFIFDDYTIDKSIFIDVKEMGHKVCIIDDFDQYNFDFADLIINFRFNAHKFCMQTPAHRLGLGFFSFSEELTQLRTRKMMQPRKEKLDTVLIFIGGDDRFGVANKVIEAIDQLLIGKRIFLLSKQSNHINMKHNTIEIVNFVENMSNLYECVDLVINGGGLTKYESGYCLLPNCAISQTSEQHLDTIELAHANLTFDLGLADGIEVNELVYKMKLFIDEKIEMQYEAMKIAYTLNSTNCLAKEIIKVSK
ncbi:glycosyl transferase [Pseudoalteromonas sp. KG3]|uniref:glycosyl transferase n=1 Tax=Pseudoalteromonas sp. KG3 TaxID=2951137 RepID=UPI00265A5B41|nr:glycosyl transferase [Pseudoalteromonas sp. KG3]WKD24686.1 glycosyl transferase [Pseudoalteromonas sp. KG3]